MVDEIDLAMAESEKTDVIHAAARMANALKDIFNDIGELPEVRARYEAVERDVSYYAELQDCEA